MFVDSGLQYSGVIDMDDRNAARWQALRCSSYA
jgi:hypothetical protein